MNRARLFSAQALRVAWVTLMAAVCLTAWRCHAWAEVPAPALCRLVVRNASEHEVTLYADGHCLGTVAPRGTLYAQWERGETWLYGRASCHPVEWRSTPFTLGDTFTWDLTP